MNYQKKLKQYHEMIKKGLINKFSILNRGKYFRSGSYLVFIPANILVTLLKLFRVNLMEFQKKLLKI